MQTQQICATNCGGHVNIQAKEVSWFGDGFHLKHATSKISHIQNGIQEHDPLDRRWVGTIRHCQSSQTAGLRCVLQKIPSSCFIKPYHCWRLVISLSARTTYEASSAKATAQGQIMREMISVKESSTRSSFRNTHKRSLSRCCGLGEGSSMPMVGKPSSHLARTVTLGVLIIFLRPH